MGIISWILVGIVAGYLAKWIMPGKDPGGFWITMIIGIVGAMVGGFIASNFLGMGKVTGFNIYGLFIATGGSVLLLAGYRLLKK